MTTTMNVRSAATDGVPLEGRLRLPPATPAGAALVLHPHPAFGGHMDVWLLPAIAAALSRAGWASLRLNFRGVEGSGGQQSGGAEEHLDAEGGLATLRERVPAVPTAVVGWSFGAMIGLRLGTAVDRWLGIGTPTRHVAAVPLRGPLVPDQLPPHRTAVVGAHDQFFPPETVGVLDAHEVVVVPGADHFMFDADVEVAAIVARSVSEASR